MIELIRDYYVDPDPHCYVLRRRGVGTNKKGEMVETEKTIGYYGSVAQAIEGAKNHCLREKLTEDKFTLTEAIRAIEALNNEFIKILNQNVKG